MYKLYADFSVLVNLNVTSTQNIILLQKTTCSSNVSKHTKYRYEKINLIKKVSK